MVDSWFKEKTELYSQPDGQFELTVAQIAGDLDRATLHGSIKTGASDVSEAPSRCDSNGACGVSRKVGSRPRGEVEWSMGEYLRNFEVLNEDAYMFMESAALRGAETWESIVLHVWNHVNV